MKPTEMKFNELPCSVQESLLWDMELEYDGYESSKAECIHQILCGSCSTTNEFVIKNFMLALSKDVLRDRLAALTQEAFDTAKRCQMLLIRLSP